MASISTEPNGHRTVQFIGPDKKRRSVRLGQTSAADAKTIAEHIEHLANCWKRRKPPCKQTDQWVAGMLEDSAQWWLYDRLAKVGLVTARDIPEEVEVSKLGPFIASYIESRTDIEEGTAYNLQRVRQRLVDYFGEGKLISDITPADADAWRLWLQERVGANTTRRSCGRAKQFFRWAVRKRLLEENPFADMKNCTVQANKEREFFIDRVASGKVLESCPDAEWQLLFALSRFGGLRCPSEHLALTWDDIDWEHGRMTIHAPKTKRYAGKESRVIPIFPEMRPYLEAVFNEAEAQIGRPPSPSDHVITRYRRKNVNLRTQLERILKRAGLAAWPKLFQNLRASRATELAAEYPSHVAAYWLGHSALVAQKHYWQVTDADYERGASEPSGEAVQNPVQLGSKTGAFSGGESVHSFSENPEKTSVSNVQKVTPTGSEYIQDFPRETRGLHQVGAESGAVSPENASILRWLDACPVDLDAVTGAKILALVHGVSTAKSQATVQCDRQTMHS
jgi:integrase